MREDVASRQRQRMLALTNQFGCTVAGCWAAPPRPRAHSFSAVSHAHTGERRRLAVLVCRANPVTGLLAAGGPSASYPGQLPQGPGQRHHRHGCLCQSRGNAWLRRSASRFRSCWGALKAPVQHSTRFVLSAPVRSMPSTWTSLKRTSRSRAPNAMPSLAHALRRTAPRTSTTRSSRPAGRHHL